MANSEQEGGLLAATLKCALCTERRRINQFNDERILMQRGSMSGTSHESRKVSPDGTAKDGILTVTGKVSPSVQFGPMRLRSLRVSESSLSSPSGLLNPASEAIRWERRLLGSAARRGPVTTGDGTKGRAVRSIPELLP